MKGSNKLTLCPAAMQEILQPYIESRFPGVTVVDVTYHNYLFEVEFEDGKEA